MTWRFADLPVRTKFLITLGIPVVGLVLLIGKQVDSSLKRRDVLRYVSVQSMNIRLLGDMAEALQQEGAGAVAWLSGLESNVQRMVVRRNATDAAILRLGDPDLELDADIRPATTVAMLDVLRERVLNHSLPASEAELEYRRMAQQQIDNIAHVFRQAMDPETNERLFAHLSLLNAKEALNDLRMRLTRALAMDPVPPSQ
ncbi:MAG: nitrate- and nitrite sensing domain-containing protein, partial [Flavobacteriales bacterium]|nr:nitrate- and nitrite sensing domain-containing protein [Flavobacteriales bacterium]